MNIGQQGIKASPRAKIDPNLCHHVVSLDHNESVAYGSGQFCQNG